MGIGSAKFVRTARIVVSNGVARIPLGGKRAAGRCTRVDACDLPIVGFHRWHANIHPKSRTIYAQTNLKIRGRWTTVQLHKLLVRGTLEVDHKSGNGLDNRRQNLRRAPFTSNAQNRFVQQNNSSGFRGVNFTSCAGKWMARVGDGRRGRRVYLGLFATAEGAARAYDKEARIRFGVFARLNFPRNGERSAQRG